MDEVPSPSGLSGKGMVVPIAAIGALSEAWFDALGLARHKEVPTSKPAAAIATAAKRQVALPEAALPPNAQKLRAEPVQQKKRTAIVRTREIHHARVAPADKMRLQTELSATRDGNNDEWQRSAGRITIRSSKGAVRMLVQRDRNMMKITAVCSPENMGAINDALQRARLRLQSRGIRVETLTVRENAA